MNCYAGLDDLKGRLGISLTTDDARLVEELEAASREIDRFCNRHFYVEAGTRYFDTQHRTGLLLIDDCLAVSALSTDSELDGTHDGETWTEGDDFALWPWNKWPKEEVRVQPDGNYAFAAGRERYVKIVGSWGYGDGDSGDPWESAGCALTVSSAAATSGTISVSGAVQAGQTILVAGEQIFVGAVSGTAVSGLERGVNGTSDAAAAHSGVAAERARYPRDVWRFCVNMAAAFWLTRDMQGMEAESKGEHNYRRLQDWEKFKGNALGRLRKG